MSWTKLSDDWTDRADLAGLSFEDRWHYLAMIQLCSRSGRVDGLLRVVDARRCSDHPDPAGAITRLAAAGKLEVIKEGVRLVEIEDHVPPPSVRNKAEQDKLRKRRQRAHHAGDHSQCLAANCEHVTGHVTRDSGTGQDGPVQADSASNVTEWPTAEIPSGVAGWVEQPDGAMEVSL